MKSGAGIVRELKEDEVLELLAGPRTEEVPDTKRARVKASKDNAGGYLVLSDRTGTVYAEPKKLYSCTASVAMTDNRDINDCKVVRKLVVGELFEAISDPVQDEQSKIWRMEGTALKDGKTGWVTQKGNAGTTYVELSKKHFTIVKEAPLKKKPTGDATADVVRQLEVGEAVELLEAAKIEKAAPEQRIEVRALLDGAKGWIPRKEQVTLWKAVYKCLANNSLKTAASLEDGEVLRELAKGERLEFVEGPVEDGKATLLKGRCEKDGMVGWVCLKNADDKRVLALEL